MMGRTFHTESIPVLTSPAGSPFPLGQSPISRQQVQEPLNAPTPVCKGDKINNSGRAMVFNRAMKVYPPSRSTSARKLGLILITSLLESFPGSATRPRPRERQYL